MTSGQHSHDGAPALEPEPTPLPEAWPGPAEAAYSVSEEEEIAARLEALGYLE
jgi:hypothetical protein